MQICAMQWRISLKSFAIASGLLMVSLVAAATTSPEFIEGTTRVNAEEFVELVGNTPDLTIVDSRIRGDRKKGYLEGSISLPDIETDCTSLARVIPAKQTPSVFYCNGVKCGRSVEAIRVAQKCGYSNIYWFRGGFEEWLEKGYPYLQE